MKKIQLSNEKKASLKRKIVLFDIDDTLFNTAKFKETNLTNFTLFDEVIPTLSALKDIAELGIFSEGGHELQNSKLANTNISNYFSKDHIYIVKSKNDLVRDIFKKYNRGEKVFIIDDRLIVLQTIKQIEPSIFTIWLKQGRYAKTQQLIDNFIPDARVKNLLEIIPYIKNS